MEIITSIKDNGIGMEEDLQKLIFTINRNVKREGTLEEKGTGLGLNLCKEMVTKQGGRIWLESEEGKGSTFYFSLPAAEEEN
jgi:signal transduction histidine kinase